MPTSTSVDVPAGSTISERLENGTRFLNGFGAVANEKRQEEVETRKAFLPVLIIPGFMSSGLEVVKSTHKQAWEGKRIWLNLSSLGIQSFHLGGSDVKTTQHTSNTSTSAATTTDEKNAAKILAEEGKIMRNMWLQHMALDDDMKSERDGVQVRNIPGLAGVDYLTPGALTSTVSYVFGPVIRALQKAGYEEGVNLDAAPYDWRVPPSVLEIRDGYFTKTMAVVEDLYQKNKKTPVVLVCHSLGCKTGHYFLNFAKSKAGQKWIDQYIHTYMPVGGPHLGAPKALRSTISGDKMGLEAFLKDSEALILGRSLGSGAFLVPGELPPDAPSNAFIREDGALEIKIHHNIDSDIFLNNREDNHRPGKLRLTLVFAKTGLSTPYAPIDVNQNVQFGETFTFRTPSDGPSSRDALVILLCEPGVNFARRSKTAFQRNRAICFEKFFGVWVYDCDWLTRTRAYFTTFPWVILKCLTCWCIIWPIIKYTIELGLKTFFAVAYCAFYGLYAGTVLTADEISKVSGGSSILAEAKIKSIRSILGDESQVEIDVDLESRRDRVNICACCTSKRKTTVTISIKWISGQASQTHNNVCSDVCQQPTNGRHIVGLRHEKMRHVGRKYTARSGYDIVTAEELPAFIDNVKNMYDADPLDPRGRCSSDAPPVRLVKAIYGINLPTEVGAVYKRHRAVVDRDDKIRNLYTLDPCVRLGSDDGYVVEGGILKETKNTRQLLKTSTKSSVEKYKRTSGDGTVPYWSLQHVRTWENDCEVSIDEIDGAEHREILADKRFQNLLLDYVCAKQSTEDV